LASRRLTGVFPYPNARQRPVYRIIGFNADRYA
jgi:hypothetical protein